MAQKQVKQAHTIAQGLINYLKKNNQLNLLPQLIRESRMAGSSRQLTNQVEVVSATALIPEQMEELKAALEKLFNRELSLNNKVDPAVIAGIKVSLGDLVIDQTVKQHIQLLAQELTL